MAKLRRYTKEILDGMGLGMYPVRNVGKNTEILIPCESCGAKRWVLPNDMATYSRKKCKNCRLEESKEESHRRRKNMKTLEDRPWGKLKRGVAGVDDWVVILGYEAGIK